MPIVSNGANSLIRIIGDAVSRNTSWVSTCLRRSTVLFAPGKSLRFLGLIVSAETMGFLFEALTSYSLEEFSDWRQRSLCLWYSRRREKQTCVNWEARGLKHSVLAKTAVSPRKVIPSRRPREIPEEFPALFAKFSPHAARVCFINIRGIRAARKGVFIILLNLSIENRCSESMGVR